MKVIVVCIAKSDEESNGMDNGYKYWMSQIFESSIVLRLGEVRRGTNAQPKGSCQSILLGIERTDHELWSLELLHEEVPHRNSQLAACERHLGLHQCPVMEH